MKKTKISREMLFLAIFTTITVFTWIGLETYQALSKKQTPPDLTVQLRPLNPTLDTKVIEDLKNRKFFNWEEVQTPASLPTKEATKSGQL